MKMPGLSFGSTVTAATAHEKLEWAASILTDHVFCGRHTFVLTANPDGTTRLDNIETFSGALVWPFQGMFKRNRKPGANGYDGFNQALKSRVESRIGVGR
ncbi:MAG: hypothetical protein ACK4HF_17580 [Paracoccaceae bacterium]